MDDDLHSIPIVGEGGEQSTGEIKINLNVITKIVELATSEVPGVLAVAGGSFLDGMFAKREARIAVDEDEIGGYLIRIPVVLEFGVDLAKTAQDVQNAVRDQVKRMTSKTVSRVDVIIDDVKRPTIAEEDDDLDHPMD